MAKDVRCSVTTCAYHDSNNKCLANEIKVSKRTPSPGKTVSSLEAIPLSIISLSSLLEQACSL